MTKAEADIVCKEFDGADETIQVVSIRKYGNVYRSVENCAIRRAGDPHERRNIRASGVGAANEYDSVAGEPDFVIDWREQRRRSESQDHHLSLRLAAVDGLDDDVICPLARRYDDPVADCSVIHSIRGGPANLVKDIQLQVGVARAKNREFPRVT